MASHVLFLLHGIGQRAPLGTAATERPAAAAAAWYGDVVPLLVALAKKYAPDIEVSLDPGAHGVRIVPLSYCEVIVDRLNQWQDVPRDPAGALAGAFPALAGELQQLHGVSESDAPYFWGGPIDVVFYRLLLAEEIRAHVRRQIATELVASSSGGTLPSCSFICHSMGTAVLHDTLAELWGDPAQFQGFVNMDVWLYAAIANVSKVLATHWDPHTSVVRPKGSLAAGGAGKARISTFLNAHHVADPVAWTGLFHPAWNPDSSLYLDVETSPLKWVDVHGLVHYLQHPRVHIPILRVACGASIRPADEAQAIAEWDATAGDRCPMALNALSDAVHAIRKEWRDGVARDFPAFVKACVAAWKAIETARAACHVEAIA